MATSPGSSRAALVSAVCESVRCQTGTRIRSSRNAISRAAVPELPKPNSSTRAAPLTAFIASFSSPQGLFFAKLTGPGTVWLQSLPLSRLASRIFAAAPQRGGSREEGSVLGGFAGGGLLGGILGGDDE